MSTMTLDLTKVDGDDLAAEVKRRIKAGHLAYGMLDIASEVSTIGDDDLVDEVNRRLKGGDIEPEAIEVEPEAAGGGPHDDNDRSGDVEFGSLDEAAVRFARRDYSETLWCLEKALGPAFAGLGDFKMEKR